MNIEKQRDKKIESSDHFQLLFDYKIKKEKGTANTSQLLIELESTISKIELNKFLLANKYFNSLLNVSILRPFLGKVKYHFNEQEDIEIFEVQTESVVYSEIFQNDDIGSNPVKVTLVQLEESSAVLFQFNHIFIDNNGVKNLLLSFYGQEFDFVKKKNIPKNSFFTRLKNTTFLASKMLNKWYEKKAFIHSKSKEPIVKEYLTHTYSDEESTYIKSKVKRSHHISSISSMLMGSCCIAIKELLIDRKEELKEFVFQQPFEVAPKKESPYILGNRFSFIHYRLQPEAVTNLTDLEFELNRQTLQQIKDRTPHLFMDLESVLRNLPLKLHLWMISLPAKGKMTTFAYTFIDEAKVIDEFAGRKITNMVNIPPVMRRPPVTFGFCYYESRVRILQCYDKNTISDAEAKQLFNSIKQQLLD